MHFLDLPKEDQAEIESEADVCIQRVSAWCQATHNETPVWLDRLVVGSFSHGDATEQSDVDLILVPAGDLGLFLSTGICIKPVQRELQLQAKEFKLARVLHAAVKALPVIVDRPKWRPIAYSLNHKVSCTTLEDVKALYAGA